MQRLSPDEILKSYARLKCEPSDVEWVQVEERKVSPTLGLAILAKKYSAKDASAAFSNQPFETCCKMLAVALNSHIAYIAGFELGFAPFSQKEIDNLEISDYIFKPKEYLFGFEDGLKAFRAMN